MAALPSASSSSSEPASWTVAFFLNFFSNPSISFAILFLSVISSAFVSVLLAQCPAPFIVVKVPYTKSKALNFRANNREGHGCQTRTRAFYSSRAQHQPLFYLYSPSNICAGIHHQPLSSQIEVKQTCDASPIAFLPLTKEVLLSV